jgi:SNF2 family DNA or RNA helicase
VLKNAHIQGSKLAVLQHTIAELLDNQHKALVFSQFVDHLAIVRAWLDEQGIAYQYLDGSTPAIERKKRVDAFQAGQGDIFLISLKAGGTGLNLTAADYVIHLDPWWNPAVEDQASDRAHRMGQQRPVTIYRLVTQDTIEEKILALHKEKRDLADSLLDGGDMAARLDTAALLQLLKDSV